MGEALICSICRFLWYKIPTTANFKLLTVYNNRSTNVLSIYNQLLVQAATCTLLFIAQADGTFLLHQ